MQLEKSTVKKILIIVGFGVVLYWALNNLASLAGGVKFIWGVLRPFITGIIIAFLINIPMRALEKRVFKERFGRLRRPLSFLVSVVLILSALGFVVYMVVPQLWSTMQLLGSSMPGYLQKMQSWLSSYEQYIPNLQDYIRQLDWAQIAPKIISFLQSGAGSFFNSAFTIASSVVSGAVSFFVGIIFACYLLLDKERLLAQLKGLLKAYLPEARYNKITETTLLVERTFSQFVSGQCLEALAVGTVFCIVLLIGRFEYAMLIGVLIGFMSLIPIFGSAIACVVGTLLILMAQGWLRALIFVVIFVVIQQLDGNFMYPYIVGNSVGLPPIWVLVAVTAGASLLGLWGMLLFIPLASVLYSLLRRNALTRLKEKGIVSPTQELPSPQTKKKRKKPKAPKNKTSRKK